MSMTVLSDRVGAWCGSRGVGEGVGGQFVRWDAVVFPGLYVPDDLARDALLGMDLFEIVQVYGRRFFLETASTGEAEGGEREVGATAWSARAEGRVRQWCG